MHCLPSSPTDLSALNRLFHRPLPRVLAWLGLLLTGCLLLAQPAAAKAKPLSPEEEFSQLVTMAPVVVQGQSLSISIHARTKSDRRYGEKFSEEVIKVIYEAVTDKTGRGLVIIGAKGEPHPIFVFRKFLALAEAGKLDPEIAALGPELETMMHGWAKVMNKGDHPKEETTQNVDMEYDRIVTALPLPLKGVGAKLYQLAWDEKFDEAKVEARLCALRPGDLERRDLFKNYDWAFYLPPKGAFNKVIDELISDALKEEDIGFFTRTMIKGALLVVKPIIRRAIEGFRHGMMFMTVVDAQTNYDDAQVRALTEAYFEPFMPDEKESKGSDHERAVRSVKAKILSLEAAKAAPQPAVAADAEPETEEPKPAEAEETK